MTASEARAGRVLIIAGSDSGGGAGIQADIKTVTALGGYAATAITALTAQNTRGVHGIVPIDPEFVARQIAVVLDDIGADAIKTGMLGSATLLTRIIETLDAHAPGVPLIVDPVMVAKGGDLLLPPEAATTLADRLVPRADLITPNLREAEVLGGRPVGDVAAMAAVGQALLARGPRAVLVKGGHLPGDELVDLLVTKAGVERFTGRRIATRHTHGTGCTLASAIATGIAQGLELAAAVARARAYLDEAIRTAPGFGAGHGPVNHGHPLATR